MDQKEFVAALKRSVRDSAVEVILTRLAKAHGRRPSSESEEIVKWYGTLTNEDRSNIAKIVRSAADEAVFGFLVVIDGDRIIDERRGDFELSYRWGDERVHLNSDRAEQLHNLFVADDRPLF